MANLHSLPIRRHPPFPNPQHSQHHGFPSTNAESEIIGEFNPSSKPTRWTPPLVQTHEEFPPTPPSNSNENVRKQPYQPRSHTIGSSNRTKPASARVQTRLGPPTPETTPPASLTAHDTTRSASYDQVVRRVPSSAAESFVTAHEDPWHSRDDLGLGARGIVPTFQGSRSRAQEGYKVASVRQLAPCPTIPGALPDSDDDALAITPRSIRTSRLST